MKGDCDSWQNRNRSFQRFTLVGTSFPSSAEPMSLPILAFGEPCFRTGETLLESSLSSSCTAAHR
jgi:hypothetical protein